jgi:hypothetical protein
LWQCRSISISPNGASCLTWRCPVIGLELDFQKAGLVADADVDAAPDVEELLRDACDRYVFSSFKLNSYRAQGLFDM